MSNLNSLLSKAKSTKKTLWQRLYEQFDEIEQAKKSGKTYKEIAEDFDVSEAAFSRALKQAKEAKTEKNEAASFAPQIPKIENFGGAQIEEIEFDDFENDDVENNQNIKQDFEFVSEQVDKFEELVSELKEIEQSLISSASEAVVDAVAAAEVSVLTLKITEAEADVKKYALSSRRYIDKLTAQTISLLVEKSASTIQKKLEEAEDEINKQKSKFKPSRWTFAAVLSCIVLCSLSYYAGTQNYASRVDYNTAKADQKKWSGFVTQWKKGTEEEKKALDSMMSRR